MNICILKGIMRKNGNTQMLTVPFTEELLRRDIMVQCISLPEKRIHPCRGCAICQQIEDEPSCILHDDMDAVYEAALAADCIVFASPIYHWSCTAPLKGAIDRFFCMYKTPAEGTRRSLLQGKSCAVLTTCGGPAEVCADLFEASIRRFADYNGLDYKGMLCIDNLSSSHRFPKDAPQKAVEFSDMLIDSLQ